VFWVRFSFGFSSFEPLLLLLLLLLFCGIYGFACTDVVLEFMFFLSVSADSFTVVLVVDTAAESVAATESVLPLFAPVPDPVVAGVVVFIAEESTPSYSLAFLPPSIVSSAIESLLTRH